MTEDKNNIQESEDAANSGFIEDVEVTPEEVRQRETEIQQRKAIAQVLLEAAKADKDAILDYINSNDLKIESVKNAGDEVVKLDKKIKETNQETQDLQEYWSKAVLSYVSVSQQT